jgi:hypothetical protein
MGPDQRRLVFERVDAAALLLFNIDRIMRSAGKTSD